MTVKQRKADDLVYKKPNAGFMSMGCYILIMGDEVPEGCIGLDPCLDGATTSRCQAHAEPCQEECFCANDFMPCFLCEDEDCREWYNTVIIHGETLAEAKEDIVKLRVARTAMEASHDWHMAYHVSECEMEDAE